MKIIIIGAGKVGYSLAKQLSKENYSVTVIDSSEDTIDYINSNLDVFAIHGNGANFEVQKRKLGNGTTRNIRCGKAASALQQGRGRPCHILTTKPVM